jgi:hypothetical protein
MPQTAVALRPRSRATLPVDAALERRIRRTILWVWGLLFLNVLTFYPKQSVFPIPSSIGKAITQGALQLAILLALSVNRKLLIRPNVMLSLMSLLALGAVMSSLQSPHFGTIYRTVRLVEFVAALWLLTPWWGRRDMILLRSHMWIMGIVTASVLVGLLIAPNRALVYGRLSGAIWPIAATQVAHYAAVTAGLAVVLWFCSEVRGRTALIITVVSLVVLILTHTRTALVGLVAGILVSGLSLIAAKPRVRKLFSTVGVVAAVAVMTLSSFITTWLARGEGTTELVELSGRTPVWNAILNFPRDRFQVIFGYGLSNASANGFAIDSNWLASYQELGLWGVMVCASVILFLLINAYFQPRGAHRALALFLITYCLVASFTEVGFTDANPYLLDLAVAAALLMSPVDGRTTALQAPTRVSGVGRR